MNRIFLFVFFIFGNKISGGQEYKSETDKAGAAYDKKQYDSCSFYFEKAFKIKTGSATDLYNAAVCNTMDHSYKRAFALLSIAIKNGANISKLKIDPDLQPLQSSVKWKKLIRHANRIQADSFRKCEYPEIAAQLAKLWEADQYYRFRLGNAYRNNDTIKANSIWPLMRKSDTINLAGLEAIIEEIGWPTISKVGHHGASTAFLIIDHSPREVMEKYFPLLEQAMKNGQASKSSYATMKDRILVNRGKKQIYGTQKYWDQKLGRFVYFPIEDEKNVNALRKEMDLEPISFE
jgi:hypothetical protein